VAVTALALTGSLSPRVIERQSVVSSAQLSSNTVPSPKTVRALATGAAAAVVQIHVAEGAARRTGSAVVLRADGALLTSAALVRDVASAKVVLADGRQFSATVAGRDPGTGLAVLRIPAAKLTPVTRTPSRPRPGDLAVTVAGQAGPEAEPSVTSGVVSSLDRSFQGDGVQLWGLIETDSPVPTGADGGALVGPDGKVGGVSLHLPSAGGMGYAVPIDLAWTVGLDLLEHGRARVAWLGVDGHDLGADEAEALGVDGGAALDGIDPGGPCAEAGLQVDDVIVRLGTTAIHTMKDLAGIMKAHRPGDTVTLAVARDGDERTVEVTLGEKTG
jgi:S1-C subfamily serine protease